MPSAVLFIQWDNYAGAPGSAPIFSVDPLTYNSRQPRLHELAPGDRLWLVSRAPDDRQYYFVAVLTVAALRHNPSPPRLAATGGSASQADDSRFGEYAIVADRATSHDLHKRFPAEGLLRAFQFETGKPITHGASLGQSLQTLRALTPADDQVLAAALRRLQSGEDRLLDAPFGLWTKCDRVFADYFLKNWNERRRPLAFLLYDSPPVLPRGAPVFIHSDKDLRLVARFLESQYIAGQRFTVDDEERLAERERIWTTWRVDTLAPPAKADFDAFWTKQHGVRGLFVMDEVAALPRTYRFREYGRALEWGYPTGVGYRYLSLSQTWLLLRETRLSSTTSSLFQLLTPNPALHHR